MNGPARLDLLIPVAKPHGKGPSAQEHFDALLRKDEHRSGSGTRKAPTDATGLRPGESARVEPGSRPLETVGPVQDRAIDGRTDVYLALGPAAKPERMYAAHLVAGDYLSTKGPDDEAESGGEPDRPSVASAASLVPVAPAGLVDAAVTGATAIAGEMQTGIPVSAAMVFASHPEGNVARVAFAYAEAGVGESDPSIPTWLPQMARLTVSPEGVVTLWIRDFAASHDDIADRVAELRGRATSEGMRIGVVMVNGRPWNHTHHGKENDA